MAAPKDQSSAKVGFSLSSQIVIGFGIGILAGVFLGELAAPFSILAEGYIKLLQMTVLPYVTVSLVSGLGVLDYGQAKRLFTRVGSLLLLLWALTLLIVFLMPLSFPSWETASFFSSALVKAPAQFDFLSLYIPSNPFNSLANNVVPAVVLFSAVMGIALIGIENKAPVIELLHILTRALTRATRFVVRLTPIGVFAIAANAAGTLSVEEFGRLQVFFITYITSALLISLWLLPGLVSALTSIPYREIFAETKDALMTAFVTGNLFIVLPILSDASKHLLQKHGLVSEDDTTTDIIVPASYNFPHTGKVLTLSFILFAGWFAGAPVSVERYPGFAVTGLMSFFGSVNAAVPFLLDLFRIPADMFELFVASGVINSRFGTLIAAMHMVVLAVAGTCAVVGALRWNVRRLARFAVISAGLIALSVGSNWFLFTMVLNQEYDRDRIVAGMQMMRERAPAVVHREPPSEQRMDDPSRSRLAQIREQGVLRVGYLAESLPYAFFNGAGDLVGLDVEMAHALASEMNVRLELVPVERQRIEERLQSAYCDVLMSGFAVTTHRAASMVFSAPYLRETVAFLVRDHRRNDFSSREAIAALPTLRVGAPPIPHIRNIIEPYLPPDAEIQFVERLTDYFTDESIEPDAFLITAERGSVWSLLYPHYNIVVPQPDVIQIPLAYPVARGDETLARFLSTWIELKRDDGTLDRLYDHWILGKNVVEKPPRWSVVRNVLGWID